MPTMSHMNIDMNDSFDSLLGLFGGSVGGDPNGDKKIRANRSSSSSSGFLENNNQHQTTPPRGNLSAHSANAKRTVGTFEDSVNSGDEISIPFELSSEMRGALATKLMQDFAESGEDDTVSVLSAPQPTPDFDNLLKMFDSVTSPIAKGRLRTPGPDYPDLTLHVSLHVDFKEKTNKALQFFKEGNISKVVAIIRHYVLSLKAHKLCQPGCLKMIPDRVENLNLRLLFMVWYSFHYERQETTKRRRGRGMMYSTREVLAIDIGMYRYPPVTKRFAGQDVDFEFQWAEIKQDQILGTILEDRSKESICDKAKVMCKERMWESLKYFYKEQIRLRKDIIAIEIKYNNRIANLAEKYTSVKKRKASCTDSHS